MFQSGENVRLILKDESQLAQYQKSQLSITTIDAKIVCSPPAAALMHLDKSPIRYLICCTKAYAVTDLLFQMSANLSANSIIILMHNGLGVIDEIKSTLPDLRIISGICTHGGYLDKPYSVNAFLDGCFYLGAAIGNYSPDEINTVSQLFKTAGLPCRWVNDIQSMAWEKFAINCSINLLTALLSCKNGGLLQHLVILEQLVLEIVMVLNAYGVELTSEYLFNKVTAVIQNTAENYSSMYQDVHNNRMTELCYLNEHLVRLAKQKQLLIPHNIEIINQFYTLAL